MEHLILYNDMTENAMKEEVQDFETKIIKDFELTKEQLLNLLENLDLTILNLNAVHLLTMLDYYKFNNMSKLKEIWLFSMYDQNTCSTPVIDQITNPFLQDYLKSECCINSNSPCITKIKNKQTDEIDEIAQLNHSHCLKYLISKINNTQDLNKLLFKSCVYNNIKIVKIFSENSMETDIEDKLGYTPFLYACMLGHIDIAELLLEKSPKIYAKNNLEYVALFFACDGGHTEIIKLLLKKDIKLNENQDFSLVSCACRNNHAEIVKLFLEKNIKIDKNAVHEYTPLYWACYNGNEEILSILLEKDVEIDVKKYDGEIPLLSLLLSCRCDEQKINEIFERYKKN